MAVLDELAIGLGRIVASQIRGAQNAVLLSLKFLEDSETDDDTTGESSTEEPYFRSLGMYGRPRPAVSPDDADGNNPAGAAEVIALKLDDRAYPVATRDLRISAKVNPKDGEIGLAHYLGGFVSLKINDDGDGTDIVIYAPHQDGSGVPDKSHAISLNSQTANSHISMMHSFGQSITLTKEGGIIIANKAGDAYIEVNDSGTTFNGNTSLVGGVDLGGDGVTPGEFVMLSILLLTWIGQVNANLGLITTQLVTLGQPGFTPPTAVPVASSKVKAAL